MRRRAEFMLLTSFMLTLATRVDASIWPCQPTVTESLPTAKYRLYRVYANQNSIYCDQLGNFKYVHMLVDAENGTPIWSHPVDDELWAATEFVHSSGWVVVFGQAKFAAFEPERGRQVLKADIGTMLRPDEQQHLTDWGYNIGGVLHPAFLETDGHLYFGFRTEWGRTFAWDLTERGQVDPVPVKLDDDFRTSDRRFAIDVLNRVADRGTVFDPPVAFGLDVYRGIRIVLREGMTEALPVLRAIESIPPSQDPTFLGFPTYSDADHPHDNISLDTYRQDTLRCAAQWALRRFKEVPKHDACIQLVEGEDDHPTSIAPVPIPNRDLRGIRKGATVRDVVERSGAPDLIATYPAKVRPSDFAWGTPEMNRRLVKKLGQLKGLPAGGRVSVWKYHVDHGDRPTILVIWGPDHRVIETWERERDDFSDCDFLVCPYQPRKMRP